MANDVEPVQTSREGAVGIIELTNPKSLNALSTTVFAALNAALDAFEREDSGIRVVHLRAQGKNFCAGADLTEAKALREDPEKIAAFIRQGHAVMRRFEQSDLPVVAGCQGLALAGGAELTLVCDVVFASTDFRFGDQHAQYGLIPGFGGTQRLARVIGLRRSLDLMFSASWIDAETARQWGLVNHVVERAMLHEAALAYCTKLATRSRPGITAMKRLTRDGLDAALVDGLTREATLAPQLMLGEDVTEGLAAFETRREPVFRP